MQNRWVLRKVGGYSSLTWSWGATFFLLLAIAMVMANLMLVLPWWNALVVTFGVLTAGFAGGASALANLSSPKYPVQLEAPEEKEEAETV